MIGMTNKFFGFIEVLKVVDTDLVIITACGEVIVDDRIPFDIEDFVAVSFEKNWNTTVFLRDVKDSNTTVLTGCC